MYPEGESASALLLLISFPALLTQGHPRRPGLGRRSFSPCPSNFIRSDVRYVFSLKRLLVKAPLCGNFPVFWVCKRISDTFLWLDYQKTKKRPLEETLKDSLTQFSPRSGRALPAGSLSEGCGGNGVNSQGKWNLPPLKIVQIPTHHDNLQFWLLLYLLPKLKDLFWKPRRS